MPDVAVTLQTPIMRSVRSRLKDIQEEHGHENMGETIGWLIDEVEARGAEIDKPINMSELFGPSEY